MSAPALLPPPGSGRASRPAQPRRRHRQLLCAFALLPVLVTVHLLCVGYTLPHSFPRLHRQVLRLLPRSYSCVTEDGPACRKWVDVITSSHSVMAKAKLVVVSAGEVAWVKQLSRSWRAFDAEVAYNHISAAGEREAGRYLRFIVQYYDHLPEHIAFVHGHRRSWHQSGDIVEVLGKAEALVGAMPPRCRADYYITLSDAGVREGSQCPPDWCSMFQPKPWGKGAVLRNALAAALPELGHPTPCLSSTCCAQFMVPRERIRARPLAFWQRALDYVAACPQPASLPGGAVADAHLPRQGCYWNLMEYVWHLALGNPARDRPKVFHEPGLWTDDICTPPQSRAQPLAGTNATRCQAP
mmetsp:Transcript_27792/g.69837  ORF Transcript_27792/g.69837 Transcript_27792/m.69837 type:complete len:355 (+) Transcript_27792:75-1139(+)